MVTMWKFVLYVMVVPWVSRPTVKRRMDCGMDSFRGLTGSESML